MIRLSVILCCYNSAVRIAPTLEALASQETDFPWELVIVDNCSTDNTAELATQRWLKIGNNIPMKIVQENIPGLSAARKKGIETAGGELLLFCDDDNQLASDYLNQAAVIMNEDKEIGALCGFNNLASSNPLPDIVEKNKVAYACGHKDMESRYLDEQTVPWGAGLVVRSEFMKKLLLQKFVSLLSDRTGKELSSGGDTEYCYLIRLSGYKWKYDTRLSLNHCIPEDRLNMEYLKRLYKGFGEANMVIECYYRKGYSEQIQHNLTWWKVFLAQCLYFLKNPIQSEGDQRKLEKAYRKGYMKKLWQERTDFQRKQSLVKDIISKLPHVS
jgi:glycosyltransferase involved in cell wall biosynthesis